MKTIYEAGGFILKVGKNGMGQWCVFKGHDGKATQLVYKRTFATEEMATKWAHKWLAKK